MTKLIRAKHWARSKARPNKARQIARAAKAMKGRVVARRKAAARIVTT